MKLSVYSLKNILFQGEALSLNCKTVMGEITILDHHETLITVLSAGVVKVVAKDPASAQGSGVAKEHFFEINSGFLEVKPGNEVRCIVE